MIIQTPLKEDNTKAMYTTKSSNTCNILQLQPHDLLLQLASHASRRVCSTHIRDARNSMLNLTKPQQPTTKIPTDTNNKTTQRMQPTNHACTNAPPHTHINKTKQKQGIVAYRCCSSIRLVLECLGASMHGGRHL